MDLHKALSIAASGMPASATRLRVIAGNLANQGTAVHPPAAQPHRQSTKVIAWGDDLPEAGCRDFANRRVLQVSRGMLTRALGMLK